MDEKKKYEINDEMLSEVSGGADVGDTPEYRVGKTIRTRCLNSGCKNPFRMSTAVITEIIDERTAKLKMECCGMEWVGQRISKE